MLLFMAERQPPFKIIAEDIVDLETNEGQNIVGELDGTQDPRLLALRGVLSLYLNRETVTLYGRRDDLGYYYLCLAFAEAEEGYFREGIQAFDYAGQLAPNGLVAESPG